jgi:alkylhydroperoxidase family enzyme
MSPEEEQALDATLLRIAERHGHVSNLLQTLALAPEGLAAFADLGSYTAYGSHLTEKQRQLANVIAGKDVHYCWSHHAPLAMAAGVTEAQLMAIREGRIPRDLDTADSTVCEYALEIAASRRLPPRIMELLQSCFTPRQIVDIALLTVQAMSVAALSLALGVPLEPPETLALEQDWQRAKTGEVTKNG